MTFGWKSSKWKCKQGHKDVGRLQGGKEGEQWAQMIKLNKWERLSAASMCSVSRQAGKQNAHSPSPHMCSSRQENIVLYKVWEVREKREIAVTVPLYSFPSKTRQPPEVTYCREPHRGIQLPAEPFSSISVRLVGWAAVCHGERMGGPRIRGSTNTLGT